jgi:uncharacterized protein YkwD
LRKLTVAVLAIPVLAPLYVVSVLRGFAIARAGVGIAIGTVIALGVISFARPDPTVATRPTEAVPLTQAAFTNTVATAVDVDAPVSIAFSTPMEPASVAAALTVEPPTGIELHWDEAFTSLTVTPTSHWEPETFHTVTVEPGALARTGRPLTTPARSSFLTRGPSAVVLAASDTVGKRVAADTSFTITFERPVDPASLAGAIRLDPAAPGALTESPTVDGLPRFAFTPAEPLLADTRYRLIVDGVRDEDGVPLEMASMSIRTTVAPAVVRFRPRDATRDIDRDAAISVRFTRSMDRASTKAAFAVTADGKALTGKISFAERDRVLVFVPAARLPYDAKVVATVAATARSAEGAALAGEGQAVFRTEKKPAPKPQPTSKPISKPSGGGSVGSGSWAAVERYYLKLMNCTRTGGIVTSGGDCSSPGGRNVAPLALSSGISSKVARPYAKLLATRGECSHFIGGNPGDRLRRAGYTNYTWAENLGCRSGNPYSAVLASHRYFQSERTWSPQGGHYVNMMNAKYDRVGIGVWVSSGRVRLVVVFYHP